MTASRAETLAWVLIYSGLLLLVLGLFLRAGSPAAGWALVFVGALDAAAGALLIVLRSRMAEPPQEPKETP